jgi:hypothetical protein
MGSCVAPTPEISTRNCAAAGNEAADKNVAMKSRRERMPGVDPAVPEWFNDKAGWILDIGKGEPL